MKITRLFYLFLTVLITVLYFSCMENAPIEGPPEEEEPEPPLVDPESFAGYYSILESCINYNQIDSVNVIALPDTNFLRLNFYRPEQLTGYTLYASVQGYDLVADSSLLYVGDEYEEGYMSLRAQMRGDTLIGTMRKTSVYPSTSFHSGDCPFVAVRN